MNKFQLERIALFSDAVFAIAVTLMIIEIKAPHLHHDVTFTEALNEIIKMSPIFTGTILSFFFIGFFWLRHHQLMKYLTGYNFRLLIINLAFLLAIALLPFSTAFVFENLEAHTSLPLLIYNLNYIVACLLCYALFAYVLNPKNNLRVEAIDEDEKTLRKELLFPNLVYLLVIGLAFIDPAVAPIGYAAFAFEGLIIRKKKKVTEVTQPLS